MFIAIALGSQLLTDCIYFAEEKEAQPTSELAVHKQAFHTIAKCVGAISLAVAGKSQVVMMKFVADVENPATTVSVKLLALFSIGEIGRHRSVVVVVVVVVVVLLD